MYKNFIKILARFIIRNITPSYYFHFIFFLLINKKKIKLQNQDVLLALNPFRFREDLEILESKNKDIIIYRMLFKLQCFLFTCFYTDLKHEVHNIKKPKVRAEQLLYQNFLRSFLLLMVKKFKIKAVIGAGIHYKQDYDIAYIFKEIGIPVLIFHREGNLASEEYKELFELRCLRYKKFHGTALMVHNNIQKKLILKANYLDSPNIHIVGVIRMDSWLNKNKNMTRNKVLNKRVVLFSFGPGAGIMSSKPPQWPDDIERYMPNLCRGVHRTFIDFAIQNPDIEVVIKCKWDGKWKESILKLLNIDNNDLDKIPNLIITADKDAQNLISISDVVCGFGSTTLLEAAIAGKAVIIPHFSEIAKPEYFQNIFYKEYFDCFDIARSSTQLYSILEKYSKIIFKEGSLQKRREAMFEDYISPCNARASINSYKLIKNYIKNNNKSLL
jgi:hypothetical protein